MNMRNNKNGYALAEEFAEIIETAQKAAELKDYEKAYKYMAKAVAILIITIGAGRIKEQKKL